MTEISSSPGREAPAGPSTPTNPATQDGFTDISLDDDSRPLSATSSRPIDTTDDEDKEDDNDGDTFAEARQYPPSDDGGAQDAAPPPLPARPRPAAAASPYDSRDVYSDSRPSTPPPPPPRPTGSAAATPRWAGAHARPMSIDAALASDSASSSSFAASPAASAAAAQQRRRHTARSSYLNRPLPQTPSSPTASSTRSSWRDGQPASPSATYASFSSPLSSILSSPLAWRQSKDSTRSFAAGTYDVPRALRLQSRASFLPTPRHSRSSFYSSGKAPSTAYAAAAASGEGHSFELLDSDDVRYRPVGDDGDDDGSGAYAYYYRQHQHQHQQPAAARDEDYHHVWLRARQSAARMARRRQWSADANKGATLRALLETAEGVFEVQACFLTRLARAENDSLDPASFPHSLAEQDQQREAMATMRQETVEALQPLLTYGPSRTSGASSSAGGGSKYGDGGITTLLPPAALLRGSDSSSTSVAAAAEVTMPPSAFGGASAGGSSSAVANGKATVASGHRRRRQLPPTPPRSPNLSSTGGRRRGGTDSHASVYSETSQPADGSWMRRASLVLFGANNGGGGGRGSA